MLPDQPELRGSAVRGCPRLSFNSRQSSPLAALVSTCSGQLGELQAAGCATVYSEKISGALSARPELGKVLRRLQPGDTLVVTRLDRLARSTRDLLNTLDTVHKAVASFRSLADAWCDTRTPHGKLLLTVLGGLAEFERTLILTRTTEGAKRAKAAGVSFGRPPALTAHQRQEAIRRHDNGEPVVALARSYGCDRATMYREGAPTPSAPS